MLLARDEGGMARILPPCVISARAYSEVLLGSTGTRLPADHLGVLCQPLQCGVCCATDGSGSIGVGAASQTKPPKAAKPAAAAAAAQAEAGEAQDSSWRSSDPFAFLPRPDANNVVRCPDRTASRRRQRLCV